MHTVRFNAGDTILAEGDEGDTALLIVGGSVEVIVGEGRNAKNVGTLNAGDVFGEMSLIDPAPRSATVRATTDTECVVTSYDEFMGSIQANPDQAIAFMKTLVRRLRQMNELMASMGPGRRRLRDMFRDWQKSAEQSAAETFDDAEQRRLEMISKDGGPAFPQYGYDTFDDDEVVVKTGIPGMSLRDYFAAAALTGCVAQPQSSQHFSETQLADLVYKLADAMLAKRETGFDLAKLADDAPAEH